jgi:hypothetical protein
MNESYGEVTRFSWKRFAVTFIYENLPPVFLSPIAALFIERSIVRAWNVCQHRGLLVLSTRYNPLAFILFSWLVVYPASWMVTLGMVAALLFDASVLGEIDPLQMMCAYVFLFCRRLIISVKYGYFTDAEYAAISGPAPDWHFDKTAKKLIARGWSDPKNFPGLMEDELEEADRLSGGKLLTPGSQPNSPNLREIVKNILDQAYSLKVPVWHNMLVVSSVVFILCALLGSKHGSGAAIFGHSIEMIVVNLGTYIAILSGMGIMGFGLMCAFDFERRRSAYIVLDKMLTENSSKILGERTFDRSVPQDLRAWMDARKVIRSFGQRYLFRVQSYTSILLCFSFLCVAFLNFLAWTQTPHHFSTIIILVSTIVVIAFIASFAMYQAIQLQQQSYSIRSSLLNYVLELEIDSALYLPEYARAVTNPSITKNILRQLDENVNFEEITYKPTSILGYRADNSMIGSVLGVLFTGAFIAVQGFVDTGVFYALNGWSAY